MTVYDVERVDKNPFRFEEPVPPRTQRSKRNVKFRYGIQYEQQVADLLTMKYGEERVLHGQWFSYKKYKNTVKRNYCQTDIIVLPETETQNILVVECKTTLDYKAFKKLRELYVPVVKLSGSWKGKSIVGVQVCKHLKRNFGYEIIEDLDSLFVLPAAQGADKEFVLPIRKFPFK